MKMRRFAPAVVAAVAPLAFGGDSAAYPHVAGPGESLAEIADEAYGDPARENVLAAENGLDANGASVVPGFRVEIPAPTYVRAAPGDTWATLAKTWLGDPRRADWLARENHGTSWVPPTPGQEVRVFAVMTFIAAEGDDMVALARRFFGDPAWAWRINGYNFREGTKLSAGEVVLVPLPDLELAAPAKERASGGATGGAGEATDYRAQRSVEAEMPAFLLDVARGRYVEVIVRGNRMLGRGGGADLSDPQRARIFAALTEAYVAEGASGQARVACGRWAAALGHPPELSVRDTSPKIRAVCLGEGRGAADEPLRVEPDAGPPKR